MTAETWERQEQARLPIVRVPAGADETEACAVIETRTARVWMLGSVYLRVARLEIPTRLFASEDSAVAWLAGFAT